LLIFIFGCAVDAEDQFVIEDNYTIRGYVIVPSDQHGERFEVLLTSKGGEQIISRTNVSVSSFYFFTNLTSGYYDLVVRLDGFKEARVTIHAGVDTFLGGASDFSVSPTDSHLLIPNPYDVNINLEPVAEDTAEEAKRSAYTHELMAEYSSGLDDMTKGRLDSAVTHFETVVMELPDFYDARFNLGLVYEDLSRRDDAEKQFRQAHELNAKSAHPLLALGRLLLEEADIEIQSESRSDIVGPKLTQAREALNQSIALDPKLASGFYYLGAVDFRMMSYANAERELTHALELDPAQPGARITLINVYIQQKLWQDALDNVDTFLLENPSSPYRQQVAATRVSVVRRLQPAN
jgi:tetratricopeptide (TPR) repeat protein